MTGGLYNPRPVDDIPVNGQLVHGVTSNWAYDHTVDLDAHIHDSMEQCRIGDNYYAPDINTLGASALVANRLYTGFLWVPRLITFDRIAIDVRILSAGDSARLGIYNVGANFVPGTLLLDAGVVSVAAVAVVAVVINQQLAKGRYFLAVITDGTPTISKGYHQPLNPLGMRSTNFQQPQMGWFRNVAYGALPDPFGAPTAQYDHDIKPFLRPASLD